MNGASWKPSGAIDSLKRIDSGSTAQGSRELLSAAVHAEFEFTPRTEGSVTVTFSDVESITVGGFETLDEGDAIGSLTALDPLTLGNIPSNNPFIPPEVEDTLSGGVSFDRLTVELGEQARINQRETTRIIADLTGDFGENFSWEVFGTFGHFSQVQDNPNELNFLAAQQAFTLSESVPGSGILDQCADAAARAAGCVPLNIFGEGTITPAMADWIRYNGHAEQTRDQITAGGFVSGDIFEMPSGPVKAVFGVERRREEQDTFGDPDGDVVEVINHQANLDNVTVEGIDVTLLYDFDAGQIGEFDIDLRYTHYLTEETKFVGINDTTVTTVDLGEIESPEDELRFRLGYHKGGFDAFYTLNYMSGGIDDINSDADPEDDRYFKIGGQSFHRIYTSYTFGEGNQYRIYAGVNNFTDNLGAFLPTGLDHGSSLNLVSDMADSVGREFFVGTRLTFE